MFWDFFPRRFRIKKINATIKYQMSKMSYSTTHPPVSYDQMSAWTEALTPAGH